jgi:hypothetical protein
MFGSWFGASQGELMRVDDAVVFSVLVSSIYCQSGNVGSLAG